MNFLRKMLLVFLAGLLPFFLFTLAIDAGVLKTAGSSAPIKKVLADSGIYKSLIGGLLDQAKTSGGDQGGGTPLTDPTIKTAAENTFTPQFLQQNTEKVLDSVFVWLDGKTPAPDFKIDLAGLKSTFATEAGKAAQAKAATLAVCPSGLSGSASDFDAFSATCLPRGLTPALVATQVQNDINSGEGFIKDPVLSADTIKASGSNQSIFADQLKNAPKVYQIVKKTPVVLAVLALLTTFGIIFLSSSRTAGLRRAGIVFLVVGALMLIFAWGLNYGVNQKALPKMNLGNKVLQETLKTLVSDVVASVDKTFYIFGGTYAALGFLAITIPMFVHKRRGGGKPEPESRSREAPAHEPAPETSAPIHHEVPVQPAPAANPAPSKKKNIKIQ